MPSRASQKTKSVSPSARRKPRALPPLPKAPTGIAGLDAITGGGLPRGRPTLVAGGPGCGKTLLGLEFLVCGAMQYDEPGVFVAFEENEHDLIQNVASLGFDLGGLIADQKVVVDYIHVERNEIEETGEYNLDGLFIRLGLALDSIGAKRLVLDTLEVLFSGFSNPAILRNELRRLFRWLKQRGVTVIVTGERGEGSITRQGMEEYVSDCVILLDHRVVDQISTRRLRIVKYRGSAHGTNEYPFLIDKQGLSVLPITSLGLQHVARDERVSSGVPALDSMLGGEGYFRGSSILISGTAGAGKSSLSAHFAAAAAQRGERTLYFAFEESASQIMRNMRSIGLDLTQAEARGLVRFEAARPSTFGLDMHLARMQSAIDSFKPQNIIVDPITSLMRIGAVSEVRNSLTRLIDLLKTQGITALFTSLTSEGAYLEHTDVGISSLIDTWLMLRTLEGAGERNRGLIIIKSRGMAHSNQLREFRLTGHGLELVEVYTGPGGVLTGAARVAQASQEMALAERGRQAQERVRRAQAHKHAALEAQISALRAQFEAESEEMARSLDEAEGEADRLAGDRSEQLRLRTQGKGLVAGPDLQTPRAGKERKGNAH